MKRGRVAVPHADFKMGEYVIQIWHIIASLLLFLLFIIFIHKLFFKSISYYITNSPLSQKRKEIKKKREEKRKKKLSASLTNS